MAECYLCRKPLVDMKGNGRALCPECLESERVRVRSLGAAPVGGQSCTEADEAGMSEMTAIHRRPRKNQVRDAIKRRINRKGKAP